MELIFKSFIKFYTVVISFLKRERERDFANVFGSEQSCTA
jgi:hypothetical protein